MSVRAVMISVRPQWCALIANGKKTLEVRKTQPKLNTPFKCYIYCTIKGDALCPPHLNCNEYAIHRRNNGTITGRCMAEKEKAESDYKYANGKVIGEFVCDSIFPISVEYSDTSSSIALNEFPYTCLTDKQIMDYLGNGKTGYAWHISCLKIYEEPKELNEFVCNGKTINRPPQSWRYVEGLEI